MKNLSLLFIAFLLLQLSSSAQTKWYKYAGNPVLDVGLPGTWESWQVHHHDVYLDGDTLKMWYTGATPPPQRHGQIGLAISTDSITWVKDTLHNPVLTTGDPGAWDSQNVSASVVIFVDNTYKMWYAGLYGITFRIGYATSPDGITWTKYVGNPVINTGYTGSWEGLQVGPNSVIFEGAIYKMWYDGFDGISFRIGYATSSDGINWDKDASNPVLDIGEPGEWDDVAVLFADVLFDGTLYHMWYNGYNDIIFRIGYATSSDGISWEKHPDNPILDHGKSGDWDDSEVGHPRVSSDGTTYQMWFQGDDGSNSRIGYAEDFSNLVHADSVIIEETYVIPNTDTLNILGRIISLEGHALTAKAIIVSDDASTQDSVELFDDGLHGDGTAGDGIYGGYWSVTNENEIHYAVGIKTVDLETGFTRNGLNWNIIDGFTTAGPVVLDSIAWSKLFNFYKIEPYIRNTGNEFTISNPFVNLISDDPWITSISGPFTYPSLPPGNTTTGDYFTVNVDQTFPGYFNFKVRIGDDGWYYWEDSMTVVVTDVEDEIGIPISYNLYQNYSNPFNPTTTIKYQIPELSFVTLKVFNQLGEEVATLINEEKPAGSYEVEFNATSLPSGIYFYRLQAGSFVETKKMS